jgi:uncharacterized membrane protein
VTDAQQEPQVVDAVVAVEADDTGATVVGAIGDETGTKAAGMIVTDYQYAVIVAAFDDIESAKAAYGALEVAESEKELDIEGVLVVKTDDKGKIKVQEMTDHSTKTGVKWGAVGGVVLGIIFPPTILASAVGVGVVGGILGKIRNVAHRSQVSDLLAGTLGPDQSGIVALVKATDVDATKAEMPAAEKVRTAGVDDTTAKEVAKAAEQAS